MVLVNQLSLSTNGTAAPIGGPDAVALRWKLDGGGFRKQVEAGSPDRDYLWLERLTSNPIDLTAGSHTLTLEYAGADANRSAAIDGFLLMPAKLTRNFTGPDGSLVLTYDLSSGQLSIQEQ
jgi:hypothetical protein